MHGYLSNDTLTQETYASQGKQYEMSFRFPIVLKNGGEVSIGVTTGSNPIVIKGRTLSFLGSSEVNYRASSESSFTGGTPINIDNLNVKNPIPSTVTAVVNPTTTNEGVIYLRYYTILAGGGNQSSRIGTDIAGKETILPANTKFIFTAKNLSTTTDAEPLFWYVTFVELNPWE